MSSPQKSITSLLLKYQSALNSASIPLATSLYHPTDSICMPPNAPVGSFTGPDGIQKAYEFFFSMIKFDVKFEIHEIVSMDGESGQWAFARTESKGTSDVKGRGLGEEGNQELFVLKKVLEGREAGDEFGGWRIARYCFNSTNPPLGGKVSA